MLKKISQENGRSMVEMLGVLAVIGVLSVAAVAGYQLAITRHKGNELLNEASKRAVVIASQMLQEKEPNIKEFDNTNIANLGIGFTETIDTNGNLFTLKTTGNVEKKICAALYNAIGDTTTVRLLQSGSVDVTSADKCTTAPLSFTFNKNLTDTGLGYEPHMDPDNPENCAPGWTGPHCDQCQMGYFKDGENCKKAETEEECEAAGSAWDVDNDACCTNPDTSDICCWAAGREWGDRCCPEGVTVGEWGYCCDGSEESLKNDAGCCTNAGLEWAGANWDGTCCPEGVKAGEEYCCDSEGINTDPACCEIAGRNWAGGWDSGECCPTGVQPGEDYCCDSEGIENDPYCCEAAGREWGSRCCPEGVAAGYNYCCDSEGIENDEGCCESVAGREWAGDWDGTCCPEGVSAGDGYCCDSERIENDPGCCEAAGREWADSNWQCCPEGVSPVDGYCCVGSEIENDPFCCENAGRGWSAYGCCPEGVAVGDEFCCDSEGIQRDPICCVGAGGTFDDEEWRCIR